MSQVKRPADYGWLRAAGIIIGASLLIWLPFEDSNITLVLLLSALICTWSAVRLSYRFSPQDKRYLWRQVITGLLAGMAVTPLAFTLMALKGGLHGHSIPDFTPEQVISVFQRTPVWTLAGLLLGLSAGLWWASRV